MQDNRREPEPIRGCVVIFDDEAAMGRILAKNLNRQGYDAHAFDRVNEGLEALERVQPDVLITDYKMPELNGMQVLERMRRDWPDVPVLMITAFGTVERAVEAMQAGAFNFITKPFENAHLMAQLTRAMEHRRMLQENVRLSEQLSGTQRSREIIGDSPAIQAVREMIAKAAPTDSSVMITGRSGVGKELVAHAIHRLSPRRARRFVAINCPSIPPSLIESEMFGHERGAFTGANRTKMGLVELAQGGTLFLDEVAELPPEIQVKLLRVIQEREIQRVGGLKTIPVDIRIIAATNRDLKEEMQKGQFREDLFFRLNVIHLRIPTLAERPSDIRVLAQHIAEGVGRRMHRPSLRLGEDALRALESYRWPGNVRELENVIERAIVLSNGDTLRARDLMLHAQEVMGDALDDTGEIPLENELRAQPAPSETLAIDYREARDAFERRYLEFLLDRAGGNISKAAQISGISRRNLYDKLEKVGLSEEVVKKR